MQINIDTHVHSEASFDSEQSINDIVSACIKRNIQAVCICDHDISYSGPAVIDGVIIIPAIEISTDRGHLLGLFLNSPVKPVKDFKKAAQRIHDAGGITVLAHPYERHHVPKAENDLILEEIHEHLDGIEAVNSRATQYERYANKYALEAAARYDLPTFAGSDGHISSEVGGSYVSVDIDEKSIDAIKNALLSNNSAIFTNGTVKRVNLIKSQYIKVKKAPNRPKQLVKLVFRAAKAVIYEIIRPEKRYLREVEKEK